MQQLQVVVMEHHDLLRQVMVNAIQNAGFDAHGVIDSVSLHAHLHQQPVDMVVLDLATAGPQGLSTLRQAAPHMGLLALSPNHHPQVRVQAYTHGADVFLTKPCDTDVLIAALWRLGKRLLDAHQPSHAPPTAADDRGQAAQPPPHRPH